MVVRERESVAAKPIQRESYASQNGLCMAVAASSRDREPEIDYDRVVWDLDYRRHVVDELNRFHRPGDSRRDGHAF